MQMTCHPRLGGAVVQRDTAGVIGINSLSVCYKQYDYISSLSMF